MSRKPKTTTKIRNNSDKKHNFKATTIQRRCLHVANKKNSLLEQQQYGTRNTDKINITTKKHFNKSLDFE